MFCDEDLLSDTETGFVEIVSLSIKITFNIDVKY